jgi:hypothetical protein
MVPGMPIGSSPMSTTVSWCQATAGDIDCDMSG